MEIWWYTHKTSKFALHSLVPKVAKALTKKRYKKSCDAKTIFPQILII